jgi:hypothetical protein
MKLSNAVFVLVLLIGGTPFAFAQSASHNKIWRVSEAYVVLAKEKANAKGDLYEVERNFTPETPQVKVAKLRLALFNREMKKLARTNARNANKFSAAYGDLIVAKIRTEIELFELREKFTPEYIAVKRKEVELASLNSDLKKINQSQIRR